MDAESRPLRVLYVIPDLGVGGAERHVTTLMPELDRARFDPSVICIGEEGALFPTLGEAGVPAVALHRSKRQAFGAVGDLVREMRRLAPDVVITRGYNAETLGRIAAVLAGVRNSVVWVHNCGDPEPRSRVRVLADRILDRFTSAYFGVAEAQIRYMVQELGYAAKKVQIIYNGVDPTLFDPSDDRTAVAGLGIGADDPVVGILAAMRPEKDHATLLRAARIVVDRLPSAKFLLIGDGAIRSELENLAEVLGIADNVVFAGSRSDVPDLLRGLDVFVLSSFSIECFPMALLEAMAAGRPAVCTAVGGVPEMISEGVTGLLVPPHEPEVLAERLLAILADSDLRQRMGDAARVRVEMEFSLRRSVAGAERALETVANRSVSSGRSTINLAVVLDLTFVGGVEVLLLSLFKHFDPAVVRPRLICLREAGPLAEDFRAAGFDVEVLERKGRYDMSTLPKVVRSLRRDRTDAVLVPHHHRAALLLGRMAARMARVPANVVAAHDMDLASVGKRVFPRWAVSSMALSNALVLLTPAQGDYLHREEGVGRRPWQSIREVVIPNGIVLPPLPEPGDRDKARATLGFGRDEFVIGIVARLSAQKAHHVLFEAIARLTIVHPKARLVVVGGGEREDELRRLAVDLGISERTMFTGIRRDVARLLPGFDVSCLSSVHEGVPIIVIESMAAGLPIVATDCGSLRDMVTDGEHGYIVAVGDAAELARRLAALADDPELRAQFGKRGRLRVEQEFQIAQTARGYERLLTELVNE